MWTLLWIIALVGAVPITDLDHAEYLSDVCPTSRSVVKADSTYTECNFTRVRSTGTYDHGGVFYADTNVRITVLQSNFTSCYTSGSSSR